MDKLLKKSFSRFDQISSLRSNRGIANSFWFCFGVITSKCEIDVFINVLALNVNGPLTLSIEGE